MRFLFVLKSPDRLIVYIILVCISSEEAPASYWVGASLNQNGEWKWEDGTVFNITGKADKCCCCCFLHKNKFCRKGRPLLFGRRGKKDDQIAIEIKLEIVDFVEFLKLNRYSFTSISLA